MRWLRSTDGWVTRPAPLALGLVAVLAFVFTFGLSRAAGDEGQEGQAPAATTTVEAGISLRSAAALPDLAAEPGPTEAELKAAREAREARAERRRKRKEAEAEPQAQLEAEQAEAEAEARDERRRLRAERRRERAAELRAEREAEERAAQERREAQQRRLAEQRRREQAEREAADPPTTTPTPAPGGQEFDDSG